MNLKDKLDLIWKYSILAIILITLICFHFNKNHNCGNGHQGMSKHKQCLKVGHMGMGAEKRIKVEKKIVDGDTVTVVWVNGEKIDNPEEFMAEHGCAEHGSDCKGHDSMKKMKIMKKKFHEDQD